VNYIKQEMNSHALKTEVEATVKEETEEDEIVSLADIMKAEMEKSLGSMTTEIQSVRCDLHKTRGRGRGAEAQGESTEQCNIVQCTRK